MRELTARIKIAVIGVIVLLPFLVLAATPKTFAKAVTRLSEILMRLIPIFLALALLAFFWGLAKFMYSGADNPEKHSEGRTIMIWGVIALFVMVSIGGILILLANTFGITL